MILTTYMRKHVVDIPRAMCGAGSPYTEWGMSPESREDLQQPPILTFWNIFSSLPFRKRTTPSHLAPSYSCKTGVQFTPLELFESGLQLERIYNYWNCQARGVTATQSKTFGLKWSTPGSLSWNEQRSN